MDSIVKNPGPEDQALDYPWKGIVLNSALRSVGVMEWRSDAEKRTRIKPPEAGKPELWDWELMD